MVEQSRPFRLAERRADRGDVARLERRQPRLAAVSRLAPLSGEDGATCIRLSKGLTAHGPGGARRGERSRLVIGSWEASSPPARPVRAPSAAAPPPAADRTSGRQSQRALARRQRRRVGAPRRVRWSSGRGVGSGACTEAGYDRVSQLARALRFPLPSGERVRRGKSGELAERRRFSQMPEPLSLPSP